MKAPSIQSAQTKKMSFGTPPGIPAFVTEASSLSRIDYGDQFHIHTSRSLSAEQWMREVFGDTPSFGQKFIWAGLLGLALHDGKSTSTIAGWQITGRGTNWVRIENRSWFLAANLICRIAGNDLSVTTVLRYDHWFGRWWWPPLAVVHRSLVPRLLRQATQHKKPLERQ